MPDRNVGREALELVEATKPPMDLYEAAERAKQAGDKTRVSTV